MAHLFPLSNSLVCAKPSPAEPLLYSSSLGIRRCHARGDVAVPDSESVRRTLPPPIKTTRDPRSKPRAAATSEALIVAARAVVVAPFELAGVGGFRAAVVEEKLHPCRLGEPRYLLPPPSTSSCRSHLGFAVLGPIRCVTPSSSKSERRPPPLSLLKLAGEHLHLPRRFLFSPLSSADHRLRSTAARRR